MSPQIGPEGRKLARPDPKEPAGWRVAGRRLLARFVPDRGAGIAAAEADEFDAAARQAYEAAQKLRSGSPLAVAPPADSPAVATEPALTGAARVSAWASPSRLLTEEPAAPGTRSSEPATAAAHRRQAGETAPDSTLRTPSSVAVVADDFFDTLIRRAEGDR